MIRIPIGRKDFLEMVKHKTVFWKKKFIIEWMSICDINEIDKIIESIPSAKLNQTIMTSAVVNNELNIID